MKTPLLTLKFPFLQSLMILCWTTTQSAFTCSKVTIETLEQGVKMFKVNNFTSCSSVSIVNFEHVITVSFSFRVTMILVSHYVKFFWKKLRFEKTKIFVEIVNCICHFIYVDQWMRNVVGRPHDSTPSYLLYHWA